jgi:hypothetical protein
VLRTLALCQDFYHPTGFQQDTCVGLLGQVDDGFESPYRPLDAVVIQHRLPPVPDFFGFFAIALSFTW